MAIYYILLVNKEPHSETNTNLGDNLVKLKPQAENINTVHDHLVIKELQPEMDNTKKVYQINKKAKYQDPVSKEDGSDGSIMKNDHPLDQHYNNDGQQIHKEKYPQVCNVAGLGLVSEEPQPETNVDNTADPLQKKVDLQSIADNTTDIHQLTNESKCKIDSSTVSVIDSSAIIPLTNEEPPSKINNTIDLSDQEPDFKKHLNISVASVSEAIVGETRGIGGFSPHAEETLTDVRKIADNPLTGEGSFTRRLIDVADPLAGEKSLPDMNAIAGVRMDGYSTDICNLIRQPAGCGSNMFGVDGSDVDQKGDGDDTMWKCAGRPNLKLAASCEQSPTPF